MPEWSKGSGLGPDVLSHSRVQTPQHALFLSPFAFAFPINNCAMICRLKLFQRQIRSFSTVLPRLVDSVSGEPKVIQQTGKTLSWYSCGPTVYDSSHVGHARTYVQIDLLQRILSRRFGINLHSAMGITNIDDKIINKSRQTKIPWQEIASRYEEEFVGDMQRLNVKMPMSVVRVSDMIPEIVDYIRVLEDKGIAYKTSSGIYFDTQSPFYKYEKLVPSISDVESQSRLAQDPEKRHPRDFALWKRADEFDYSWDSPWGRGRPGWHIECSVNCHSLFGNHLDVHAGGIDLRFPHHCNEIAQCEAYSGAAWCDVMLHIGHMFVFLCFFNQ